MDIAVVLTLLQTLLQFLDSSTMGELGGVWDVKSQLQKLKGTMSTIDAVLRDAEYRQRWQLMSNVERDWLEKLREAFYQADDLFDKIAALTQHKELMPGNKVSKQLRLFFSQFNQIYSAFTASREIKKLRKVLDGIAKDHHDFGSRQQFGVGVDQVRKGRETYSYVCEEDIIVGRDDDKKEVIGRLLDTNVDEVVSFITIVGIGGLGKTALAKLVYNDESIKREFSMRRWVCVSNNFDLKVVLLALTDSTCNDMRIEQLQQKLQQIIKGEKYLVVLDDVWRENYDDLLELINLLKTGGWGSRVIVTSRSRRVATNFGDHRPYELKGLSEKDSWLLFERIAFIQKRERECVNLVRMGKEIVRKCANVPLAIRVAGSLLRGEGEAKWRLLENMDLASMQSDNGDGVIPVLKLSYYHLESSMKSCFSYCCIFPKDHAMLKTDLIYLWMAQGFLKPLNGQSPEDVGEVYFMTLLQRCFFQDVWRDEYGEILSCRMHDLMHDLALEVAGTEISVGDPITSHFQQGPRHVGTNLEKIDEVTASVLTTKMTRVRTLLLDCYYSPHSSSLDILLSNARCLRVLGLHIPSYAEKLPNCITKLMHLRYLDLSDNKELEELPMNITNLHNLQTLKLRYCYSLKELPWNLSKLVNVRQLDISGCSSLRYMPPGMNNLTCLHTLPEFVACAASYAASMKPGVVVGNLQDLKPLTNLKGGLEIRIEGPTPRGSKSYEMAEGREGGYLMNMEHLKRLLITFNHEYEEDGAEALLQDLQPHHNLERFLLFDYRGVRLMSWSSTNDLGSSLPNLVVLHLSRCIMLQHLPLLSRMPCLKCLKLAELNKLEYIESSRGDASGCASGGESRSLPFFPSLESLELSFLPELKGWWNEDISSNNCCYDQHPSFSRLSVICIFQCPSLASSNFPLCSNKKGLSIRGKYIEWPPTLPEDMQNMTTLQCLTLFGINKMEEFPKWIDGLSSLRSLHIDLCFNMQSLPQGMQQLTALKSLTLKELDKLEGLPEWIGSLSALESIVINHCPQLQSLPQGMRQLTALKSLTLSDLFNLEGLPEWIGCLSALESLVINDCPKLQSLPESMGSLACLTRLEIQGCSSSLAERCKEPDGQDWPYIQHIPSIHITPRRPPPN